MTDSDNWTPWSVDNGSLAAVPTYSVPSELRALGAAIGKVANDNGKNAITRERAIELFSYDPDTGLLTWRATKGKVKAGSFAGAIQANGYLRVQVDGLFYASHRLIWLMVYGEWPSNDIDHINGIRDDNRLANLREATRSQNLMNTRVRSDSSTGVKGVRVKRGRYQARIKVNGKEISVGTYDTLGEAADARRSAEEKIHGMFARAS
ncbi:hypothetical protein ABIA16_003759 [Sinorhizobium fredii]